MIGIKMPMPENCYLCRFRLSTGIGQRCVTEFGRVIDVEVTARPGWCPLQEIPNMAEPMKPVRSKEARYGMGYDYYDWECPVCHRFVAYDPDWRNIPERCLGCGQPFKSLPRNKSSSLRRAFIYILCFLSDR